MKLKIFSSPPADDHGVGFEDAENLVLLILVPDYIIILTMIMTIDPHYHPRT